MNHELGPENVGDFLGREAADRVLSLAEAYADCERRRLELTNQAKVEALRAELFFLEGKETDLKERLRLAPPTGERACHRRKARYYWAVALILIFASFFFSLVAFDPYRLGWKAYLYCIGIAVVSPFCVGEFLEKWDSERLVKALATFACVAAVLSLVFLAVIRGNVLAQQIHMASPVVVFSGANPIPSQPRASFYNQTLGFLRLVMALLAVAMELGAGMALHQARRYGSGSGEDRGRIESELRQVRERMVEIVGEITALTNSGSVFVARFWRDFYGAMLTRSVRNAITKVLLVLLGLLMLGQRQARAASRLNLVVAIDLSASVAVEGQDHESEFQKNVDAVGRLLATVPAGARVTIIGITGNSFAQPYILLSAGVAEDPGYFGERLTAAREQLVIAWRKRSRGLKPRARHTDILGALMVASQLFAQTPERKKVLVIYSDMRQDTRELNIESATAISVASALATTEKGGLMANLSRTEVYVSGVDAAGRNVAYWESLRRFWASYFERSGATLKDFSALRGLPQQSSE